MTITYKDLVSINIFTGLNGVGKTELINQLSTQFKENNKEFDVYIFDKPETNLHNKLKIHWTSQFQDNKDYHTDYSNTIVFIETHDDHIINGIKTLVKTDKIHHSKVKVFNITKNNVTNIEVIELDHNGTFSSNPSGFMDEWANQLYKLI
jgi:predicted ATPase